MWIFLHKPWVLGEVHGPGELHFPESLHRCDF